MPGEVARGQAIRGLQCQAEVLDIILRAPGNQAGLEARASHGQMWSGRDAVRRNIKWLPLLGWSREPHPCPHISLLPSHPQEWASEWRDQGRQTCSAAQGLLGQATLLPVRLSELHMFCRNVTRRSQGRWWPMWDRGGSLPTAL